MNSILEVYYLGSCKEGDISGVEVGSFNGRCGWNPNLEWLMDIKTAVYWALNNAVDNGYTDVLDDPAEKVAKDLIANDAEIELMLGLSTAPVHVGATPADIALVKKHVISWRAWALSM